MNYTESTKKKIKNLYFQNIRVSEIAEKTHLQQKEIRCFIRQSGLVEQRRKYFSELISESMRNHETIEELAVKLNCSTYRVSNIASDLNIPTCFRKIRRERQEKIIIEEYKKAPANIKQMSLRLKINYKIVMEVYRKNNLEYKNKNNLYKKLSKDSYEEIIKLLNESDLSMSEIARKYNVTKQWISHIKQKNNISR